MILRAKIILQKCLACFPNEPKLDFQKLWPVTKLNGKKMLSLWMVHQTLTITTSTVKKYFVYGLLLFSMLESYRLQHSFISLWEVSSNRFPSEHSYLWVKNVFECEWIHVFTSSLDFHLLRLSFPSTQYSSFVSLS